MSEDFTTVATITAIIIAVALLVTGHWVLFLACLYGMFVFMKGKKIQIHDTNTKEK